jgi:dienelactone hydrolase
LADVTGSSSAESAIFYVADIFGFRSQSLQGADILACSDSEKQRLVFIPDFFDGKPAELEWYPPKDESQQKALSAFFQNQGSPPRAASKIPGLVEEIERQYPSIRSWAILGFCWGGKVRFEMTLPHCPSILLVNQYLGAGGFPSASFDWH